MRAFPAAIAAALAFAAPSIASAEEPSPSAEEAALAALSEKLADPQMQDQMALMAQVLTSTLLDLEIGPLAEAMDRATDGNGPDIAPDARLRDIAPDADELPGEIAERLPEAMGTMSAMADGMQGMIPALRAMAEQMRGALEGVSDIR